MYNGSSLSIIVGVHYRQTPTIIHIVIASPDVEFSLRYKPGKMSGKLELMRVGKDVRINFYDF